MKVVEWCYGLTLEVTSFSFAISTRSKQFDSILTSCQLFDTASDFSQNNCDRTKQSLTFFESNDPKGDFLSEQFGLKPDLSGKVFFSNSATKTMIQDVKQCFRGKSKNFTLFTTWFEVCQTVKIFWSNTWHTAKIWSVNLVSKLFHRFSRTDFFLIWMLKDFFEGRKTQKVCLLWQFSPQVRPNVLTRDN